MDRHAEKCLRLASFSLLRNPLPFQLAYNVVRLLQQILRKRRKRSAPNKTGNRIRGGTIWLGRYNLDPLNPAGWSNMVTKLDRKRIPEVWKFRKLGIDQAIHDRADPLRIGISRRLLLCCNDTSVKTDQTYGKCREIPHRSNETQAQARRAAPRVAAG